MSKIIKGDTSLRYQLEDNNKGKFSEIPYEFITCISVSGTDIVIDSDIDPNNQNIIIPYASITAPTSLNINNLKEMLWCWVLSKSRKPNDENGDPYILITPEVEPCFGVISNAACPYVLQNVGGTLYWDGSPISGVGGGITTVESGLYPFNPTTARLGGLMLEDISIDGDSTWRISFDNVSNFVVNSLSTVGLNTNDGTHLSSNVFSSNLITNKVEEIATGNYSQTEMTNTDISTTVLDANTVDTSSNLITASSQLYSVNNGAGNNASIQFDAGPSITLSTVDAGFATNSTVVLDFDSFSINAGLKLGLPQFVTSTPTLAYELTNFFPVRSNLGAFTLVLTTAMNEPGRIIFVKDIGNNASVNNITITPNLANIEGAASYVINTNRGSAMFIFDGTAWWLI